MATLYDAIEKAQSYLATLEGIQQAPTVPPDQISEYPFFVGHPLTGNFTQAPAGNKQGLHNIAFDLHVAKKGTAVAWEKLIPYVDKVTNLLFAKLNASHWDSTIGTLQGIRYEFATFAYAGVETVGIQFVCEGVKIQSAIT